MLVAFSTAACGLRGHVQADPEDTIHSLKCKIATAAGLDVDSVYLMRGASYLSGNEEATLAEFGLNGCDAVTAVERILGGAKGKKKKKQYTTPKHVAHKPKKIKLAVLKYYAVEDGKIKHLRFDCAGNCPTGVKMAVHENRSHCGRCGTSMVKSE